MLSQRKLKRLESTFQHFIGTTVCILHFIIQIGGLENKWSIILSDNKGCIAKMSKAPKSLNLSN